MNAPLPQASARVDSEDDLNLNDFLEVVRHRRKLLVTIASSVLTSAILVYFVTPRQFRATTVLQVERRETGAVPIENLFRIEGANLEYYETQYRLLESRGLAERVLKNLNLAEDPVFNPPRSFLSRFTGKKPASAADDEVYLGMLAERLLDRLDVKPIRRTHLVEVSYRAPTPELASRVANGVAEAFIDWGIEKRFSTVGKASSFLTSQIQALKLEIADKEAQLQAYSRSSDIVALDPQSNVTLQRLEALNRDYTDGLSDRINKEARYRELESAAADTIADTLSGGLVAQLRAEQAKLEREYANKLTTYKPEWPTMQEFRAQIEKGRQNLDGVIQETVSKARESARTEFQTAQRKEQSLAAELARQKRAAMELNSAAVEYNNLKVEVSTRRTLLDELLRKQSETEVASRLEGTRDSTVMVVDRALPPRRAYRPSLPLNLAAGLAFGLMLGIGGVFLVEYLDRSIKTREEMERVLDLPVLAVIPDISEEGRSLSRYGYGYGYGHSPKEQEKETAARPAQEPTLQIELLPQTHPRLAVSEAYRSLRTALLLSSAGELKVIVVTSAEPGAGKTATATNLAVVMAQLGKEVLLVDADLRKPRLHEIFKVSNRSGLVSFLTAGKDLDTVVVRTEIPKLSIIPSGPIPPNPSELLSSQRMQGFVHQASLKGFDFVILDTPPVLPVTDATLLGAICDGVVLCLGAGNVLREEAVTCRDRLRLAEVKILGTVLNRFRARGGGYGKGYQSYRAYTAETEEEATPAQA